MSDFKRKFKSIPVKQLEEFYTSHKTRTVSQEEYEVFQKSNQISLSYQCFSRTPEGVCVSELIVGILYIQRDQLVESTHLFRKIVGDNKRKLMQMIEWKQELLCKRVPEEIASAETQKIIAFEIQRQKSQAGFRARNLFKNAVNSSESLEMVLR